MTVFNLVAWRRWMHLVEEPFRGERFERIRKYVFPDGIEQFERERRQSIWDYVFTKMVDPPSWDGWVAPEEPPDDPYALQLAGPPLAKRNQKGYRSFISPTSPAYRRGSLHDGTAEELDRMRERSRGSPFDADRDYEREMEPSPSPSPQQSRARWRTKTKR